MRESHTYGKDQPVRGEQTQAPSTPSLSLPKGGGAIRPRSRLVPFLVVECAAAGVMNEK
jgi:hypothetical protein